ncbi:peptidoglycan DD-metalloendopeptidase family protein [Streptomyces vinaceus]|uniref:M23 family metallopeptidase n=1 Tax=Streptomyces vinaceus TaxID=1960 RepID=UPI0035DB0C3D
MAQRNRHRKPEVGTVHRKAASFAVTTGLGVTLPLMTGGAASAVTDTAWESTAECGPEGSARRSLAGGDAASAGAVHARTSTGRDDCGRGDGERAYPVAEKAEPGQQPASGEPPVTGSRYTVASGDTLHGIASRLTGSQRPDNWLTLYEANRSVIGADPNVIHPGQVLEAPGKTAAPKPPVPGETPGRAAPEGRPGSDGVQPKPSASRVSPIDGVTGSGFGRSSSRAGRGSHTGIDMPAAQGTHVRAAAAGKVIASDRSPSYGVNVRIQHPDGTYTLYAHLSGKAAHVGEEVSAGQLIGYVGSTGNSTGPHLHFEVRRQAEYATGAFIDPNAWLRRA